MADLWGTARELQTRLATLYRQISGSTGRPTANQQAQMVYCENELRSLRSRVGGQRFTDAPWHGHHHCPGRLGHPRNT